VREKLHVIVNVEEEVRAVGKLFGYLNFVKGIWLSYVDLIMKMSLQFRNFELFGLCMSSCYCPITCKDCMQLCGIKQWVTVSLKKQDGRQRCGRVLAVVGTVCM